MNSIVELIFNKKVIKKCNLWVYKQCTYILFIVKSQHFRLLFNKKCINSNRATPKRVKKKKKKTQLQITYAISVESKQ